MKAVLGVLLCYLLFTSECFALKGGPPYPTPGTTVSTGQFAGALLPNQEISPSVNSIGIFSILFTPTGIGTGTLLIFQTGQTYTGTIQGIYDTQAATVAALLNATFPYVELVRTGTDPITGEPIFTLENFLAVASGSLTGQVIRRSQITGTSTVDFSLKVNQIDSTVTYDVFGFAQG